MKKFLSILLVVASASLALNIVAQMIIGDDDLQFFVQTDGTILTPVLQKQDGSVSYGFYNLAGRPITESGDTRARLRGAPTQEAAHAAIFEQYSNDNATITVP